MSKKRELLESLWSLSQVLYNLHDEGYLDDDLRLKSGVSRADADEAAGVGSQLTGRELDELVAAAERFSAAFAKKGRPRGRGR